MREILFRGKVADEPDEWVYGYLVDEKTIFQHGKHKESKCCGWGSFFVKPETIGQYTGLTDKNGTKIFEGDILKLKQPKDETEYIAKVEFGNPNGNYNWGWQLVFIKPFNINSDILCWVEMECVGVDCEVISNIHDNPELLEGL